MPKTKFTPGPWEIRTTVHTAIDKGNKHIAMVNFYNHPDESMRIDEEEHQANVRLISKTPELLTTLKEMLDQFISSTGMTDTYCDVCAVHAHKYIDKRGNWTGAVDPIVHKPDCVIGQAEKLINYIED